MKIVLCVLFSCLLSTTASAISVTIPSNNSAIIPVERIYNRIASLKVKEFQKMIGRKMTLKERISFFILQQKLRQTPKDTANQGKTALIFGIAAVSLLVLSPFLPFLLIASVISSILAIIKGSVTQKRDPGNKNAKTGRVLGIISLLIITMLLLVLSFSLSF